MPESQGHHPICPVKRAFILSTGLRRLLQNPEKILAGLVKKGQTVIDLGCGPGFFSIPMAKMVGDKGLVIAVDLQPEMLEKAGKLARRKGVESRIRFHQSESDKIGITDKVDFVLAFAMVHEVPDPQALLREVYDILKSGGQMLLVEPKFHVSDAEFQKTLNLAHKIGFSITPTRPIALSKSVLLQREGF